MTALALILSAFVAAMGVLAIFFPGRADDIARLFADKTGLWVATAIRAVLGLGLLPAAEDSKAPALLRILGGLILIVAAATLLLGLDRHRRMIDWWLARNRTIQIAWGARAFVLGGFLIYAIMSRNRAQITSIKPRAEVSTGNALWGCMPLAISSTIPAAE